MASTQAPIAGKASARPSTDPVWRAPSQSAAGIARAAVVPTAFQYWYGWPIRFESSVSAREPGQIREASA